VLFPLQNTAAIRVAAAALFRERQPPLFLSLSRSEAQHFPIFRNRCPFHIRPPGFLLSSDGFSTFVSRACPHMATPACLSPGTVRG
jgi:hypothetical protein